MQSTLVSLGVETFKIALDAAKRPNSRSYHLHLSSDHADKRNHTKLRAKNFTSRRCYHIFNALDDLDDG